jgi:ATP-dependent DNA helicase DinG
VSTVNSFFSANGALATAIAGYQPRVAQLDMANAVSYAIEQQQHLIAEAGTGTGKTFAYLVPVILSGKRVIISTGTKNLQDQLFNKDLPLLRRAIAKPFTASLLKGRSNYLCIYRLENSLTSHIGFSKEEAKTLAKINVWAKRTTTGDIADMPSVAETDPAWYHATSTQDNCLGQDCEDYADCFLVQARKRAKEADIVVVNHHVLCADWSLRDGGFGELLPSADVVIIDEAHQLAETASNFLGNSISAKALHDLAEETLTEYFKEASDVAELRSAAESLQREVKDFRLALGVEQGRGAWQQITSNPKTLTALTALQNQLQQLAQQLSLAAVKSKVLEALSKRADDLTQQFDLMLDAPDAKWIRWYETHKRSFSLNRTPLNIANEFQRFMQQQPAVWIFTSATLSVANRFDHFANNLGLVNATSASWDSPFDYAQQALFYHPKNLPLPNASDFIPRIVEFALPVLQASRGRAFFLFTSHRALQQAAELLVQHLDYPLLVQGTMSKNRLLEQFQTAGNAVLLGTASFWEGVDVRGEALSCVIIDKLPFAAPTDPVLKARLDALTEQGKNAFMDYQVPAAVLALRQGIGRLLRDVTDRGVLMICDPRLLKKQYGQIFLDSVPPMRRTRELADVQAFFQTERPT